MTSAGIEINISDIFRLEHEYLVLRGRLAGSTEAGRVFFIPYDQVAFLGFIKEIKENQVRTIYGEPDSLPTAEHAAPNHGMSIPSATLAQPPVDIPAEAVERAPVSNASRLVRRLGLPGKDELLKRLRAKTQAPPAAESSPQP